MKTQTSFKGIATATAYVLVLALCSAGAYVYGRGDYRSERAAHLEEATAKDSEALEQTEELEALKKKYGPSRNSYNAEEWIVRDFFEDQRDGVFVDVGANHHQRYSNTFYLETALGWSGVALEPQLKFAVGYKLHRPRTTFVPLFVSDVSNREAVLYVGENDLVASSSRDFTDSFGHGAAPTRATTTTLNDILDRLKISRIDFLTMDIELAEPQALAGFSIDRFKPRLVAIEAHTPVRQQILDYFAHHDYVIVGNYWLVDHENFWFAPIERATRR